MDQIIGQALIMGILFLVLSVYYCVVALPITLIVWHVGSQKAQWLRSEYYFMLIPGALWIVLGLFFPSSKSLSNMVELFYCGIPGGLILVPRLFIPATTPQEKLRISRWSTFVACVIVFLIFVLTPALPE